MKSGKLIEVLIFFSGLGLSLITNLFTSDSNVVSFYESNKKTVLIAGVSLILLSIILSFKSQSEKLELNTGKKVSLTKLLFSVISSTILLAFVGIIISLTIFYVCKFIETNDPGLKVPDSYFLPISCTIVGMITGTRFKFIYGTDLSGAILGGVFGFASSYYFSNTSLINFLPTWLSHESIVASSILSGAIGLFTGIFQIEYEQKEIEIEKKRVEIIEPEIEAFEVTTAKLKNYGYEVKATTLDEFLIRQIVGQEVELSEKKIAQLKNDDFYSSYLKNAKLKLLGKPLPPLPPIRVFDRSGKEVGKFSSVSALMKFSEDKYKTS